MAQQLPRLSILSATNHELAEEGSYFTAKNPVAGTGLATIAAQATLADAAPFVVVKSGATKPVRFDYLRLTCTAGGTGGTALRFAARTDATKADPTGGTALARVNVNQGNANAADATVFAGPLAAAAASGAMREPIAALLKNAIPAVGDVFLIKFGGADMGIGSAAGSVYVGAPPLIIGANQLAAFHIWLPGQTIASSFEVEVGLWER